MGRFWNRSPLSRLPSPVIYVISVGLEKCFALITVPLMAIYLSPGEYGQFDVAVTLIEFVSIVAGVGMSEQLIRFASTAKDEEGAKRCARELLGAAIILSIVFCLIVQAFAAPMIEALDIAMHIDVMRAILIAACITTVLDLPLMWIRLQDNAVEFMVLVVGRTAVQALGLFIALSSGFGAEGAMVSNAIVLICFSILLVAIQIRKTGVSVNWARFREIARYGAPIVGAALAMFALGSANRLFLPEYVSDEEIGWFGLASRLAIATWLVLYPFELWWAPKRIAALSTPEGLERSRVIWGFGVALLIFSCMGMALAGPVFVTVILPDAYAGALDYLPLVIVAQSLHILVFLTSVGSYARETGYRVLMIDCAGAALAIVGFWLLIPLYGVWGAIGSIILGQTLRLGLYIVDGAKLAPIQYPWARTGLAAAVAIALVAFAPGAETPWLRVAWSAMAALLFVSLAVRLGLTPLPAGSLNRVWEAVRRVRQS